MIDRTEKFSFWCQKVLPLVYDESLSYYELLCKVVNHLNNVINTLNVVTDATNDLTNKFNELKEYVEKAFSDLDLQKEVDKKMDIYLEDGTLERIINLGVLGNKQDKIYWYPEDFGAIGDGITDDTEAIQAMFTTIGNMDPDTPRYTRASVVMFKNKGKYKITNTINVGVDVSIDFNYCEIILAGDYFENIPEDSDIKYAFRINVTEAGAQNRASQKRCFIKNIYAYPETLTWQPRLGLFLMGSQGEVSFINTRFIDVVVRVTPSYIDFVKIYMVYIAGRSDSNNFAIHTGAQGDSRIIECVQHGAYIGTDKSKENTIFIGSNHHNVTVSNIVGNAYIESNSNTEFNNLFLSHYGRVKHIGRRATFNHIRCTLNYYAGARILIAKDRDHDVDILPSLEFNDVEFLYTAETGDVVTPTNYIAIEQFANAKFTDCFTTQRIDNNAANVVRSVLVPTFVGDSNMIDLFKYHGLELNGVEVVAGLYKYDMNIQTVTGSRGVTLTSTLKTNWFEQYETDYEYLIQKIGDNATNIISSASSVKSIHVDGSVYGVTIKVSNFTPGTYAIYRRIKDASGAVTAWNKKVVVRAYYNTFVDNGLCVNGEAWEHSAEGFTVPTGASNVFGARFDTIKKFYLNSDQLSRIPVNALNNFDEAEIISGSEITTKKFLNGTWI